MSLEPRAEPDLTVIIIGHQLTNELVGCLTSLRRYAGDLRLQVV